MSEFKGRTFSDVLIHPQYSDLDSRDLVDISSDLSPDLRLSLPVISANMQNVTEDKMCMAMDASGGMGILHRFMTEERNVELVKLLLANGCKNFGVSLGVEKSDRRRFSKLRKAGAKVFCLDIAHAHSLKMEKQVEWIKAQIGKEKGFTIIAGNVATWNGAAFLSGLGVDVVKVGIGGGSACTTRLNAGVGVPQLEAIEECLGAIKPSTRLISDGGIKNFGDVAKALKYADAVMIGGMIAGTSESPGSVFRKPDGSYYKVYAGSASGENKNKQKYIEGTAKTVPFIGKVRFVLNGISDGVRSAFSYSGCSNLTQFQEKCILSIISSEAAKESFLR